MSTIYSNLYSTNILIYEFVYCQAVVKAFDAIEDFVNGLREEADISKFMLAGESKVDVI